ncbi:bifunctional 2',3'-cyclic-nucleotide 2'-phosphodiesterase/3'-nucleotidase [Acetobacter estunensis]|uniref:bifunctional 2',3'-cyclic-nucleotide 2'-phosphodiesterase/3'-nucleotidase n=1 Tax=Acetobacter estunensis TaxID=104097 RepID=UPI001C2CD0F6|nr:bifunctional 2',3'-cyclic-nucleotide 2'-phosphodiesterase/3'-nucleotidase [Acetobacter estunensis]MBV1837619.1 bifunctional 2',3'-cyclic-nucleotide 2'-phosphodiesterase/3'-nucleotidase [Acetobacter estunensis]
MGEAGGEVSVLRVRLLETSDLHACLHPYDYYRAHENHGVGLLRVAELIRTARDEVPNTLLFDNGDTLQGTPLGDYMAQDGHLVAVGVHPMIRLMNRLGYDAATLGNHEFNFGLSFLQQVLAQTAFPVVCANVARVDGGAFVPPFVVLERDMMDDEGTCHRLKIGVVGFVPPQIMTWDATHLQDRVWACDMVEAARRVLPVLRAQSDVIVALCHCGIADGPQESGAENMALSLAALPGIDALLLGHTHHVFPGPAHEGLADVDNETGTLHGKPAVMPGFWGSHLGLIDLTLTRGVGGEWRCQSFRVETRPICTQSANAIVAPVVTQDPVLTKLVQDEHEATKVWMAQPVAHTTGALTTFFTFTGSDPTLSLINDAQLAWARSFLAKAEAKTLPLLSAASPFHAGGAGAASFVDIPAGPLVLRDLASIYPYPNTLALVRCTGSEIQEWLERAAAVFNRIDPTVAHPQPLLNASVPSYTFDVLATEASNGGLTWEIDLTAPARYDAEGRLVDPSARRIHSLKLGPLPIGREQSVFVVTNSYRASGGGHFPGTGREHIVEVSTERSRDALAKYVETRQTIVPSEIQPWHFHPLGAKVTVWVDLPFAAASLAKQCGNLVRLGKGAVGCDRYAVLTGRDVSGGAR